jgi:hypothetical protein
VNIVRHDSTFPELERPDPDLPRGARRVTQAGMPGISLRRYRILREGRHAVRQAVHDRYPPTPQIVRVGTGPAAATATAREPVASDAEYAPDELLVLAQRRDPDAPLRVVREPGRFGREGWTRDLGNPAR